MVFPIICLQVSIYAQKIHNLSIVCVFKISIFYLIITHSRTFMYRWNHLSRDVQIHITVLAIISLKIIKGTKNVLTLKYTTLSKARCLYI